TTPIPPLPGGVEIATMVSSRFTNPLYFAGGGLARNVSRLHSAVASCAAREERPMTSGKRIPSSVPAKRSRVAGSAQPAASLPEPLASRPKLPKNYGVRANNRGLLPWSWAVERLEKSKNYWVASTRPDGRPHVMPVWGAWIANSLWFGTDTS